MLSTADLPDRLALLPDAAAARCLTQGVLTGQEDPPRVALRRAGSPVRDDGARWRVAPVRTLLEAAVRRFEDGPRTGADAWLAPRLHATLRMTRAEAADPALWNFLALVVAPEYVVWRHRGRTKQEGDGPSVVVDRFSGPHHKQALARLWWSAEIFRDGYDYRPVEVACGNQEMLNTALRLDIVDHRPTARALVTMLENGTLRTGREVNGLVAAVNVSAATLMYDVLAPDESPDPDARAEWIAAAEDAPPVPFESLPEGPDDGPVPVHSVNLLAERFEHLFADAPVRGRDPGAGGRAARPDQPRR